jgi:hypothetical protein
MPGVGASFTTLVRLAETSVGALAVSTAVSGVSYRF